MIYKLNMIQFLSLLCLTKEIAQIAATTLVVAVADSTPSGCRDHTNLLLALGGFFSSGVGFFRVTFSQSETNQHRASLSQI